MPSTSPNEPDATSPEVLGALVSVDLLRALTHAGNYAAGAFDGGTLVGANVGFYAAVRALWQHRSDNVAERCYIGRGGGRGRHRVIIEVDAAAPVPPYEQIRAQLATMIAAGSLPPGQRLPTVRQLAADLGLAVNTVARAYRELQAAGMVVGRVRHGTTVAARPPALPPAEVRRRLHEAARAYAVAARQLGASTDQAEQAVREQLAAHAPPPAR